MTHRHPFTVRFARLALILIAAFTLLPAALAQDESPPTIIGGQLAGPGEWPWQVALINAGGDPYLDQYCGGSLIETDWVVTAAHCVTGSDPGDVQVLAGIHNLDNPEAGYQRLDVAEIFVHPQYNQAAQHDKDVALLRLDDDANLGPTSGGQMVATVSLVSAGGGNWAGAQASISGWGHTGGGYPTQLMEAVVPVVTNADCNDGNSYNGAVTANMLCAGYAAGGVDTCYGDSGGPLVVDGPNWKLAGITSWGNGCAQPNYYGVYTRVSSMVGWIEETMDSGSTTDPYEPNNNRANATPIAYGDALSDPRIDPAGDVDFYRFNGAAGDAITVDIDAVALGSNLDSTLQLQSSSGAVLADNDDSTNHDSLLTYVLPSNGAYYIRVREYNHGNEGGSSYYYTIKLDKEGASTAADVYVTTNAIGTTADGQSFNKRDILRWDADSGDWSLYLAGNAIGLPSKADIVAFDIPNPANGSANMAFAKKVVIAGVGTVAPHDLLLYDPNGFTLRFDGSDVGLTAAGEKIDAVEMLPGNLSPIGSNCDKYVLISTKTGGTVPAYNGGNLKFSGEDVLGFCSTQLGANTQGVWHLLIDGSAEGMPRNSTVSLSASPDGQTIYLTTKGNFNVDGAAGSHSMIYTFSLATDQFSGPIWSAAAEGLPKTVDGLDVIAP